MRHGLLLRPDVSSMLIKGSFPHYIVRCDTPSRCYNAPSSNRIGWSVPVATHYQNNVTSGQWYNYTIPAMEISDTNHVLVSSLRQTMVMAT